MRGDRLEGGTWTAVATPRPMIVNRIKQDPKKGTCKVTPRVRLFHVKPLDNHVSHNI